MNIAFISPFYGETTTNAQGGAQVWAAEFLLEEIKRNQTFDLYALNNSLNIPGKINLKPTLQIGLKDIASESFFANSKDFQKDKEAYAALGAIKSLLEIKEKENTYDLVIESSGSRPLIGGSWNNFNKHLLIIGHDPSYAQYASFFQFLKLPDNVSFVFPSHFQAKNCTWIPDSVKTVIPHGIDISGLTFIPKPEENHLLFLGRYHPNTPKGLEEAVDVANLTNLPLDIYTQVDEAQMKLYNEHIIPKIEKNPKIKVIFPPQPPKEERFQKAKVALFPTMWEEPFGLVLLESMATGTPVIGFARGAVPEIIKDGETGFVVNPSDDDIRGEWITKKTGIEGLCEAVEKLFAMPEDEYLQMRKNTRVYVEKNFTIQRMVDDYEKLYQKILNRS